MSKTEKGIIDWNKVFIKLEMDICLLEDIENDNSTLNLKQNEHKKESF